MLYVAIGSLWIVSIICMMFLAAYAYQLTKRQLDSGSNSYFWTVLRVLIVFCLGLSIFYFGVASRVESLPKLVAYGLQIRSIPLWSAEAWVSLSLAFGLCGILFALTDTLRNDFGLQRGEQTRGRSLRWRTLDLPRFPIKIPYGLSFSKADDPLGASLEETNFAKDYFSQSEQFWALANVLIGLFMGCFLFVGLQAIAQVNFVQALGIQGDFGSGIAFSERVRPTPTPTSVVENPIGLLASSENSTDGAGGADGGQSSDLDENGLDESAMEVAALPVNEPVASTSQPSSAPSSGQGDSVETPAENQEQPVPTTSIATPLTAPGSPPQDEQPTLAQPATAPATEPPTPELPTSLVVIREPLGVNARTGPGITFGVITILQNGTRHTLLNRSPDGQWLNVQLPGAAQGWVASWVVDVTP